VETKTTHFSTFGAMSTKSLEPPLPPTDSQTKDVDVVADPKPGDRQTTAKDNTMTMIIVIVVCVVVTIFILAAIVWIRRRLALFGTALLPGYDNQQQVPKQEASAQGPSSFTQNPFNPPPSTASANVVYAPPSPSRQPSPFVMTSPSKRQPSPFDIVPSLPLEPSSGSDVELQQPTIVMSGSVLCVSPLSPVQLSARPIPTFIGPHQSFCMPDSPQSASLQFGLA